MDNVYLSADITLDNEVAILCVLTVKVNKSYIITNETVTYN